MEKPYSFLYEKLSLECGVNRSIKMKTISCLQDLRKREWYDIIEDKKNTELWKSEDIMRWCGID